MGEDIMNEKLGYIVMDGRETLLGTLCGYTREVLHNFRDYNCPPMVRNYEAAEEAERLRMHNYVRKSAELATRYFINPSTMEPNVDGLILATPGDYKTSLTQSDKFDPKLAAKIVNVVDVAIGGEGGFYIAIHRTSKVLARDRRVIVKLFDEITKETGKYVYCLDDTLKVLESEPGAVETLILWENLDVNRYVLKNRETGETVIKHVNKKEEEGNTENFSSELDVEEKVSLLDWLCNEQTRFGCAIEFVNNKSLEGKRFCKGLDGIGAILRYPLDLSSVDPEDGKINQEDGPHLSLYQLERARLNGYTD